MVRAGLNLLHVMKSINKIGTFPQAWETLLFCLENFHQLTEVSSPGKPMNNEKSSNKKVTA